MKLLLGLGGQVGFGNEVWHFIFLLTRDFFMPGQESRNLHGYSSLSPSPPILEDDVLQNISSWHLSATEELMWLYFYFQSCHFREAQLWKVVLLENPVNGCSYRNVPLSSLVTNPMESCFQSSAIQTRTNLLCIITFLFYLLLHKLSTWPMTFHPSKPKAQCKTVKLWLGSSLSWDGLWGRLVQNSE